MEKIVWKDDYIYKGYHYARLGFNLKNIAQVLDVHINSIRYWRQNKPAFRRALNSGRKAYKKDKGNGGFVTFTDYVIGKISPELRPLWKKICKLDRSKKGIEHIQAVFEGKGKYARQYLFVHAYIQSNFKLNPALRRCGISFKLFTDWKENDPDFMKLIEEIMFYRKNFVEDALFGLVAQGDRGAIKFLNERLNQDRGYAKPNTKMELGVTVQGSIDHKYTVDDLNLPLAVRKQMLDAVRERKQIESKVLDAEFVTPS